MFSEETTMYNHQLDTFIQVADAGSFSKAAEALFISSTAVMKQINLLEGSLEVQLFNRTPRGLTLTNAGKSYYQDAKYMIQYAKDAQVRAKNAMQSNESVIRIGTSLMTPSQFLLDLWPQVHEVHPELKFQITPRRTHGKFWRTWDRTSTLWLAFLMKPC
jgi:DNA-binding transcriptional LysR family regulator